MSAEVAAAAAHVAMRPIHAANIGHQMLLKLGWTGGGLGAAEQGIVEPIPVALKNNKRGLGANTGEHDTAAEHAVSGHVRPKNSSTNPRIALVAAAAAAAAVSRGRGPRTAARKGSARGGK